MSRLVAFDFIVQTFFQYSGNKLPLCLSRLYIHVLATISVVQCSMAGYDNMNLGYIIVCPDMSLLKATTNLKFTLYILAKNCNYTYQ